MFLYSLEKRGLETRFLHGDLKIRMNPRSVITVKQALRSLEVENIERIYREEIRL
jgi:GTP cyclohydrolase II